MADGYTAGYGHVSTVAGRVPGNRSGGRELKILEKLYTPQEAEMATC